MLTPHCSAASGIVVPPSIVSTTRRRKSAEYGFAIHAGLLPAGSLNHIRAAMGILDSAFPGNALRRPAVGPRRWTRGYKRPRLSWGVHVRRWVRRFQAGWEGHNDRDNNHRDMVAQ